MPALPIIFATIKDRTCNKRAETDIKWTVITFPHVHIIGPGWKFNNYTFLRPYIFTPVHGARLGALLISALKII